MAASAITTKFSTLLIVTKDCMAGIKVCPSKVLPSNI
jgi:hypothetical protein